MVRAAGNAVGEPALPSGYRRDWLFDEDLLAEIREADLHGASLGEAFRAFPHHPDWKMRAAVLRLLWWQHFVTDLTELLSERHVLRQGPARGVGAGICLLERDLDGRLLIRSGPGHPMRLTALGRMVLAAAQPYADQLGDLHGPRHRPKDKQRVDTDEPAHRGGA
ncbi:MULTISPECIES: hypothetical protein [unclassified Streptomyces]|uniref:hypothetical protein n=1 Tax=unclassified Streptomyces TaxID=2593676 RepID=UPI0027E2826D|nr:MULTISPECIES: hypothetical protein [unclassified Streptomyces]